MHGVLGRRKTDGKKWTLDRTLYRKSKEAHRKEVITVVYRNEFNTYYWNLDYRNGQHPK